jgi:ribosome biogenesis GTPase
MPKRRPRSKDFRHVLQEQAGSEAAHDDATADRQKFGKRSKFHQANKTLKTALGRMEDADRTAERKKLPVGEVVQVYSLFVDVQPRDDRVAAAAMERTGSGTYLCTARRTMRKLIEEELGEVVVGDRVRFSPTGGTARLPGGESEQYQLEGVIESVLPRKSILTRVDSFESHKQDPIVANADQFLIVAAMHNPFPRLGLIDRMLVAAMAGNLRPAIVINKSDLAEEAEDAAGTLAALEHYRKLGIPALLTSTVTGDGLEELRGLLAGHVTVLAGHSGVGKSSLLTAIDPGLELKVGEVSGTHQKGRHTTTSARRYPLPAPPGGAVVDTPGVKVFGLWRVGTEQLIEFFPDVAAGDAPAWRVESFERIRESLTE